MSIYKGSQFIAGTPDLTEYAKTSEVTTSINSLSNTVVKLTGNQTIAGTKTFSSAVQCAGSATTGTAITTSAISKAQNGYLKLGNGIIIQWGRLAGSNTSVTFPTAFTTKNYSICFISLINNQDGSKTKHSMVSDEGRTTTGVSWVKAGQYNNAAGTDNSYTHHWIAIGY